MVNRGNLRAGAINWLLTLPYFILAVCFLALPLAALIVISFGHGLDSLREVVSNGLYFEGFRNSFILSCFVTVEASLAGAVISVLWAKRLPRHGWFLSLLNFGASNGGISLAFAIVATLGTNGFLTLILRMFGIELYPEFNIVSITGLNFAYLCFLIPYMALLFLPAAANVREEWWMAAQVLGANRPKYIANVVLPVLWPSFISSACLVFLTSLGTYATAQAISADRVNLITLQIGYLMQTSIFHQEDAYTISMLLVAVMAVIVLFYRKANRKAERWLKN
jgi:putative spermidine/putrescine transport system permease protein